MSLIAVLTIVGSLMTNDSTATCMLYQKPHFPLNNAIVRKLCCCISVQRPLYLPRYNNDVGTDILITDVTHPVVHRLRCIWPARGRVFAAPWSGGVVERWSDVDLDRP